MAMMIGNPAVYDGISNSPWKFVSQSTIFEERDPDPQDTTNFPTVITPQNKTLGLVKMVRGRITVTGKQTFQRGSIDFNELNYLGVPQQEYVTMYFPEQVLAFTGWVDSSQVDDHLTGDLVTVTITLYVFTGWFPRLTNSGQPIPVPESKPSVSA